MPKRTAFLRNLGLKALALTIALLVWFVFSAQRRERISERSYRIPLSVVNIPPQTLIASPLPPAVDVRLRGPFTPLRQIDPDKLEAVIDLREAPRGEKIYHLAPEDINVPPEIEVISISPFEIRILLDATAEKTVPINPVVIGQPAAGYEVAEKLVEPHVARIYGPATVIAKLTEATTDSISIAERSATFSTPATVLAEAPGVRIREGQVVTVTVRLRATAKSEVTPAAGGRMRPR